MRCVHIHTFYNCTLKFKTEPIYMFHFFINNVDPFRLASERNWIYMHIEPTAVVVVKWVWRLEEANWCKINGIYIWCDLRWWVNGTKKSNRPFLLRCAYKYSYFRSCCIVYTWTRYVQCIIMCLNAPYPRSCGDVEKPSHRNYEAGVGFTGNMLPCHGIFLKSFHKINSEIELQVFD